LKLPKCGLQFKKKSFIVSFVIIFGTVLFPIDRWGLKVKARVGVRVSREDGMVGLTLVLD